MAEFKECEVIMRLSPKIGYDPTEGVCVAAEKVAEIVRCKDCRFHAKVIDEITGCHVCGVFAAPTKDDDFCSYGQRKSEVE